MMKKIFAACLVTLFVAINTSHAAAIAMKTRELRFSGNVDFDTPFGTDIAFDFGYGYFIYDYIQIGGLLGFANNDAISRIGVGGFAEYNIETDTQLIPFVGTQLRYLYSNIEAFGKDESASAVALGLYLGSKYFITQNLSVNGRMLLEVATDDVYLEEKKTDDINFGIEFGLGYYF